MLSFASSQHHIAYVTHGNPASVFARERVNIEGFLRKYRHYLFHLHFADADMLIELAHSPGEPLKCLA